MRRDRRRHRPISEALSHSTLYELLSKAGRERFRSDDGDSWSWVRDYSAEDGWVVYDVERWTGDDWDVDSWKLGFDYSEVPVGVTLDDGEPEKVAAVTEYKTAESIRVTSGRLLEALDDGDDGHRIYRVAIIESGMSLNGRLYEAQVLEDAAPLYDGAKAYDHHRTMEELETSTIQGLIGHYRNPEWTGTAIEAELHMLPSAVHARESMDASIEAQEAGLDPIIGISHDAIADMVTVTAGGETFDQVRHIQHVLSSDMVAEPSAGGRGQRIVAGGQPARPSNPRPIKEGNVMTYKELLALLRGETDAEKRQELLDEHAEVITNAGFTTDEVLADLDPVEATEEEETVEEEPVLVGAAAEARRFDRRTIEGRSIMRTALAEANLPAPLRESVEKSVPQRFTEADIEALISMAAAVAKPFEAGALQDEGGKVKAKVTKEATDKLKDRMDVTLGATDVKADPFNSYRQMVAAFFPDARYDVLESADFPHLVLREAWSGSPRIGESFDAAGRVTEAVTSSTFAEILGDSITRRLIAEYAMPGLDNWRRIVSDIGSINDFRTNRRQRMGGYGTLSTVAEDEPYPSMTTPGDEEATFAISKRGGTETLTLESIANDDLGALRRIPRKLGRAAAQTLYRFVWNLMVTNPTMTYDSTALFDGGHSNTASGALTHATLVNARIAMLEQTAYGDSSEVLGVMPRLLVVPPELVDTAFRLTTSAVAVPASAEVSDMPNINADLEAVVLPFLTDADNWYLVADPNSVPTIEVGFYRGRQDPELFVQDQPTVGSVFTADSITYKLRHIYGGAVLDHRGFYGALV